MKKLLITLIVLLLISSSIAFAEVDWSTLSTEEIYTEIDRAKAQLLTRELLTSDGAVLVDTDGIVVTLKGEPVLKDGYDGSNSSVKN